MNLTQSPQIFDLYSDRAFLIVLAALVAYVIVAAVLTFYVVAQRRANRQDQKRLKKYRDEFSALKSQSDMVRDIVTLTSTRLIAAESEIATLKLALQQQSPITPLNTIEIKPQAVAHGDESETVMFEPIEEEPVAPAYDSFPPDDLTRIWGIGPGNQKKLQEQGVFYFEQIAAWTDDEAERFNDILLFKGRIQREGWVKQAIRFVEQKQQQRQPLRAA